MSKIYSNKSYLAFSSLSVNVFSREASGQDSFELKPKTKCVSDKRIKYSEKETTFVDCLAFSPCGKFIAFCYGKELNLCSASGDEIATADIEKTAMQVRFFNKRKTILVAEKNGSVSFYSYINSTTLEKESVCLGHNSMITDALISNLDHFIITSDRDEKIRVSCYPNTYTIQSYCLGHTKFVSSLSFFPKDEKLLVSTSGDGTLRVWNYVIGRQVGLFVDERRDPLMKCVTAMSASQILIAVQKYQANDLLILTVHLKEELLTIEIRNIISVNCIILDICVFDSTIFYLLDDEKAINAIEFANSDMHSFLDNVNKNISNIAKHVPTLEILFKRDYNNVDDYLDRKRARIAEKESGKKIS